MNPPELPGPRQEYAGLFTRGYRLAQTPWTGPDFSRVCWIFPGQGSTAPGMLASEFRTVPVFRDRLAEADALAVARGLPPVSDFVFGRPVADDVLAFQRVLALFTASVAIADHLWSDARAPELATAFSFGETSALTALGAVSFAQMFEVVCRREECCPPPNSVGLMIAISAAPAAIGEALAGSEFHVSNLATPRQTVISVRVTEAGAALRALRQARLAARALKDVPHPFHTPWLADASARLAAFMRASPPTAGSLRVPFLSSVLCRVLPAGPLATETVIDLLSRQLIVPVDFVRQIQLVRAAGCHGFIEVGPGEVCSRFVEDILPARERRIWPLAPFLPAAAVAERPAERLELTPARHRLLGGLTRAISRLTGYELTSITVENRFQEDLGIDSIKKADILFTVVREAELPGGEDLNVSGIRTVEDAVRFLDQQTGAQPAEVAAPAPAAEFHRMTARWRPAPAPPRRAPSHRPVHVLAYAALIDGTGRVEARDFLAGLSSDGGDLVIVDRGDARAGEPLEELVAAVGWFRDLIGGFTGPRLNLALVTCDATQWPARSVAAFLKSLTKETPALVCRWLQFDRWPGDAQATMQTQAELDADGPIDLRFEKGERLAGELVRCGGGEGRSLPAAPVVIAFGGARGITHALLRALAPEWRGRLHIVGRTAADAAGMAAALAELGGAGTVEYHALDAANAEAVAGLFARVHAREGRIDLVVNGAGIEHSALLVQKSEADVRTELGGKLGPALAIFSAARRWTPARMIHFSSAAARFGNTGQTVYALASQAIDELARDFAAGVLGCAVTSIHWPGWDGVGMTAAPGVRQALLRSGVSLLPTATAVALFREELADTATAGPVVDYFAPRDAWGFVLGLRDLRSLAPLIGRRHGIAGFERVFDLETDVFLRDHCLEGHAYLPAAFAVTMCQALASHTGRGGRLENFQMLAPIVVEDAPVRLILQAAAGGEDEVRLVGRTASPHFSCVAARESAATAAAIATRPRALRIEPASLYGPAAFFHGPAFQVLHEIWGDTSGALTGEMNLTRLPPIVGLDPWDRLVQAIDGCFQLLGLEGLLTHRVMALPTSIGIVRCFQFAPWPARVRLATDRVRLAEGLLTGDIVVTDGDERVLVELRGIGMRVLRTDVVSAVRSVATP